MAYTKQVFISHSPWRLESLRSSSQRIGVLVRAWFLVGEWLSSGPVLTWQGGWEVGRRRGSSLVSFLKGSNSILKSPHLWLQFSSVQLLSQVWLWLHGHQHARPPCPSPAPRTYSNSCLSSQWCHPTISSSVIPFSSCLQSFPASGSLPMSQFFMSGGQSIGVSASVSVLPMNIQDWFSLGWACWISL